MINDLRIESRQRLASRPRPEIALIEVPSALGLHPSGRVDEVLDAARAIWQVEREQASRIAAGETLRAQTSFDEYLSRRANDLSYTLRQHLRQIGGAIEE